MIPGIIDHDGGPYLCIFVRNDMNPDYNPHVVNLALYSQYIQAWEHLLYEIGSEGTYNDGILHRRTLILDRERGTIFDKLNYCKWVILNLADNPLVPPSTGKEAS